MFNQFKIILAYIMSNLVNKSMSQPFLCYQLIAQYRILFSISFFFFQFSTILLLCGQIHKCVLSSIQILWVLFFRYVFIYLFIRLKWLMVSMIDNYRWIYLLTLLNSKYAIKSSFVLISTAEMSPLIAAQNMQNANWNDG